MAATVESSGGASTREEASPDLIARARRDRAAFAELYDLYVRRVYVFCALRSATREEAEDLTAQTFERALAAIDRYEDRGWPFSAWLLRIAAHAAVDRARHAQPITIPDDDEDMDDVAVARPDGEDEASQWEMAVWLREHLSVLPEEQRRVVRLRYYDGCSFAEIGQQLGRSEGAVKQLLRRSLTTLRARIHAEAQADD